jgi:hypothetical protein
MDFDGMIDSLMAGGTFGRQSDGRNKKSGPEGPLSMFRNP